MKKGSPSLLFWLEGSLHWAWPRMCTVPAAAGRRSSLHGVTIWALLAFSGYAYGQVPYRHTVEAEGTWSSQAWQMSSKQTSVHPPCLPRVLLLPRSAASLPPCCGLLSLTSEALSSLSPSGSTPRGSSALLGAPVLQLLFNSHSTLSSWVLGSLHGQFLLIFSCYKSKLPTQRLLCFS